MLHERQQFEKNFQTMVSKKLSARRKSLEVKQIQTYEYQKKNSDLLTIQETHMKRKDEIAEELKAINKTIKNFIKTERLVRTTEIYLNQQNWTTNEVKRIFF